MLSEQKIVAWTKHPMTMQAVVFEKFHGTIKLEKVAVPPITPDGVLLKVTACGLCRSDWHGWMGHDDDVQLPHVPGHELTGIIVEKGKFVKNWAVGQRVTLPFSMGCGQCPTCYQGDQQICDHYYQPGFTGWGAFAEYVSLPFADVNLVEIPAFLNDEVAAILGCRFITAYRGLVTQGTVKPGQWVGVFGCGGVGLSAIAIAHGMGALPIAIDIDEKALTLAQKMGAVATFNPNHQHPIWEAIRHFTNGGLHLSMDALGHQDTCVAGIQSLRKRGKHLQIGLLKGKHQHPSLPMGKIIAHELEIIGSHGMQAHEYPAMLKFIEQQQLPLDQLIGKRITLGEVPMALTHFENKKISGIQVMVHA